MSGKVDWKVLPGSRTEMKSDPVMALIRAGLRKAWIKKLAVFGAISPTEPPLTTLRGAPTVAYGHVA